MKKLPVETKDVITDIINEFTKAIDMSITAGVVQRVLKRAYDKGLDDIGLQLDMNFTGNPKRLEFLQSYTFENIKDMNDEMAGKLRKEISQSLLNLEGIEPMKKRIQEVMDTTINRARMIARTEANRAANMGHLDGARESGLKIVKEWDAHLDNRTSPICTALNGKRVGVDEQFVYKGEKYDAPPAHPNCRSVLTFIQVDEEPELKYKYIRRTGSPGHYVYWYRNPKTGKLFRGNKPQLPKKRAYERIPKEELAKKLEQKVLPHHKKKLEANSVAVSTGRDTRGIHYDQKMGWSQERKDLHKPIFDKYDSLAKKARTKKGDMPKVIFMAGLPASGKTYATQDRFSKVEGGEGKLRQDSDGTKYLILNADDIKEMLPEYDGGLGASITHNESSVLNAHMVKRYTDAGVNVILDGTLAKFDKAAEQLLLFHEAGYTSELLHIDVPVEQAMTMAAFRYKTEGRYVPYSLILGYDEKIKSSVQKLAADFHKSETLDKTMDDETFLHFSKIAMED